MQPQSITKTCKTCGEVKPLSLFQRSKDKYTTKCKACAARISNEYYHANKERVRAKANAYRQQNGDKVRSQERAGCDRHRDEKRVRDMAYYTSTRDRQLVYRRKQYRKNEPEYKESSLKRLYGLTLAQYHEMLDAQGGVCAICKGPPTRKRLAVDHDHTTGAVRGLLCESCNMGVGRFKDSPEFLESAAMYLREHSKGPV